MTDPSGLNSSVSKVTDLESLSNDFFRHWVAANPWKVVFIPSDKFQGFDLIQKKTEILMQLKATPCNIEKRNIQ